MQADNSGRTVDLIKEARQTCRRTNQVVDELKQVRTQVQETVTYFRWWRFLGYDPAAIDFLEKLDMQN